MISIQIEDKQIENLLYKEFKSTENIKEYLYEILITELEDKKFGKFIKDEHKKDYVSKDDIFKALDNIK